MKTALSLISQFAQAFTKDPLYQAGFSDAVEGSGLTKLESKEGALHALSYVHGYADAMRQGSRYGSARFYLANLVGLAMGTLYLQVDEGTPAQEVERLLVSYTSEMIVLTARLGSERGAA